MSSMEATNERSGEENERKEEKERKVSLWRIFSFAAAWDYVLMALGTLGACVHGASLPFFLLCFGRLINVIGAAYFFPASLPAKVAKFALDFVYLGVVVLFSAWAEVACWTYTGERQAAKMRIAYVEALLNQDIAMFDTEASTAEMIAGVASDVIVVQDAISEKVGKVMHCVSRFIVGFAIGFSQIWQIGLVTLSIVPLIAVAGGLLAYTTAGFAARMRKSYVKAEEIAEEVMGNIRTVKAFVGEDKAVNEYRNALMRTYQYGKKAAMAKGLGIGSLYAVLFCVWGLLIWFTSIVVHKKISNGAEAFTTMITVFVAGLSLGQAAPHISTVANVPAAARPIFEMIERNKAKKAKEAIVTMPCKKSLQTRNNNNVRGHIQFNQVHFSYPSRPNVPIFQGLDLDIPPAKIVALAGGSGSGKSTIISLIERFYDPLSGNVLLDGQDIKGLDLQWLRQQIGLVNQEPALFATTILDNILYGKEGATIEEVNRAASLANASMFINNLPDQYQTQVGERGIQLSGGQKQRIAIARVMLKNPRILLLDEATSALDAESEKSIQEGLDHAMLGRTTVVVAHRLSTIRAADVIVVLNGGRVVETGTHNELIRDPTGAYASLVQLQASAPEQGPGQLQIASVGHSKRSTSFRGSFHSDKDSFSYYGAFEAEEATNQAKATKVVSARRLYSMVGPDWNLGLVGTMVAFATGAQMPLFTLGITQALVAYYMDWETTQREIRKIALLFCGGALLTLVFHTMQYVSFGIMGERLALRVRQKTFSAILQNKIEWFDEASHNSAILSSRLENDATLLRTIVIDRSGVLLQNLGLTVTAFIITFILSWRITLVVLATFPMLICANISEQLFLKGFGGNLNKAYLKANMIASEAVGNMRTVASFCLQDKVIKLFASELDEPARHSLQRGHIAGIFYGFSQCCLYSSYGLALWHGSVLMSRGQISFPSLMKTFMVLVVSAYAIADTLAMAPDIIRGNQMAESVFELMDTKTDTDGANGADGADGADGANGADGADGADGAADDGSQGRLIGMVEFKGVEFCYPSRPEEVVFRDMDLRVRARKTMALVGMSGSGKSTVLALILRFYDPSAGKVLIDGKDIRKFHLKYLRKKIGLVQQEPALFATTIHDNIAYGNNSATEAEVIQAAKIANAHSFISMLPEGYSTKVGERGVQLSGGQKQRVAIARAVLKDPVILLLDEATSALDVETERVVQQALDRVVKARTTIVVAHRLSTVRSADTISVLQEGKIVEQGNHENLLEDQNGAYYKLISLQQHE